jgi:hypothetical protein
METQKNAKTIEGALPKSVGGTGAGNWNIDGDSYQFVPGKMENCDLVKFDDAGNKVEKGQGGFSDQNGDHGTQGKG